MGKPVCLVLGAGAGIGGHVAQRFAREGYHACLVRRTDQAGLDRLVAQIQADGGSATGFIANTVEEGSIEALVERIEATSGPSTWRWSTWAPRSVTGRWPTPR
jgi:NAD(P)-dependent dehydrogenase (short-subunit alcohol dehydrogenase family)